MASLLMNGDRESQQRIGRATVLLAAGAAVGAIASFAKELVVARQFGASAPLDTYLLAFAAVTFVPTVVGFVLQSTFPPAFIRARDVASVHGSALLVTTGAAVCFLLTLAAAATSLTAQAWIPVVAPGLSADARGAALDLVHFLLPLMILVGINELLRSALLAGKAVRAPAFTPLLPPAFAAAAVFLGGSSLGVLSLGLGWLLGTALQAGVLLIAVFRTGTSLRHVRLGGSGLTQLLVASGPYLGVAVMASIFTLIDQHFASWLMPGTISSLGYADRIFRLPLTVLIVAISAGSQPFVVELISRKRKLQAAELMARLTLVTLCVLVPVAACLMLFAEPIVAVVYARGAFGLDALRTTASVVRYSAVAIPLLGLWYLYDRAMTALRATKWLLVIAVMAMLLKIVAAAFLLNALDVVALPISTAAAFAFSVLAMHVSLRRRLGLWAIRREYALGITIATIVMIMVAGVSFLTLDALMGGQGLLVALPVGLAVYVIVLSRMSVSEAVRSPGSLGELDHIALFKAR